VAEEYTVDEVAKALGVSSPRVRQLIQRGELSAERFGTQWSVPRRALDRYERTRWRHRGRPFTQLTAWRQLERMVDELRGSASVERLDEMRRRLRPRASHQYLYVHPSLVDELVNSPDVVASGRKSAARYGLPVDDTNPVDIYLRSSALKTLERDLRPRHVADGENVRLHVVDDAAWPFDPLDEVAPLWVAWLDLADEGDRAADTVLDRLAGGRVSG
jgi:excisionase family DNA binding protein